MKRTLFILLALLAVAAWADELVNQTVTSKMYGGPAYMIAYGEDSSAYYA